MKIIKARTPKTTYQVIKIQEEEFKVDGLHKVKNLICDCGAQDGLPCEHLLGVLKLIGEQWWAHPEIFAERWKKGN